MITLILIVLAAPAKGAGDGSAVVVGKRLFATRVHLLLLLLHHKALVLFAVRGMYQRSLLFNGLAPEECAHIVSFALVRARAWALWAASLSTALPAKLIGIEMLVQLFF